MVQYENHLVLTPEREFDERPEKITCDCCGAEWRFEYWYGYPTYTTAGHEWHEDERDVHSDYKDGCPKCRMENIRAADLVAWVNKVGCQRESYRDYYLSGDDDRMKDSGLTAEDCAAWFADANSDPDFAYCFEAVMRGEETEVWEQFTEVVRRGLL